LILQGVALRDVVQGGHLEAIAACTENMGLGLRGSNEKNHGRWFGTCFVFPNSWDDDPISGR